MIRSPLVCLFRLWRHFWRHQNLAYVSRRVGSEFCAGLGGQAELQNSGAFAGLVGLRTSEMFIFRRILHFPWPQSWGIFVASVFSVFLVSCSGQQNQSGQSFAFPPASVKLGVVQAGAITDASTYTGMVVSRQSVSLMPQVDGHV